jgi:hypothetical protein
MTRNKLKQKQEQEQVVAWRKKKRNQNTGTHELISPKTQHPSYSRNNYK